MIRSDLVGLTSRLEGDFRRDGIGVAVDARVDDPAGVGRDSNRYQVRVDTSVHVIQLSIGEFFYVLQFQGHDKLLTTSPPQRLICTIFGLTRKIKPQISGEAKVIPFGEFRLAHPRRLVSFRRRGAGLSIGEFQIVCRRLAADISSLFNQFLGTS